MSSEQCSASLLSFKRYVKCNCILYLSDLEQLLICALKTGGVEMFKIKYIALQFMILGGSQTEMVVK